MKPTTAAPSPGSPKRGKAQDRPDPPQDPLSKPQEQMTRADSLQSMAKFGKIVSPAEQAALKPKKKPGRIPFVTTIIDALGGKK